MAKKLELKRDKFQQAKAAEKKEAVPASFAFGRENYIIMLAGIGLLVIGYVLMIGGGSEDPNKYNEEIFSARRITVAPVTLLIGFGVVLYGIMKKPKQSAE